MPEMRRVPNPKVPNPRVVVTRELADVVMGRMEQLFDTTNNRGDAPMDPPDKDFIESK